MSKHVVGKTMMKHFRASTSVKFTWRRVLTGIRYDRANLRR